MYIPSSTYRIQFHRQYTFGNLLENLDYLKMLGSGAVYASPVFGAVPGSMHGYDVTSPLEINSDIGSEAEFELLSERLKSAGIGWIQDIVPNHMAFHPLNGWLMDVLEKGKQSAFAGHFDIDWNHPQFMNKLMVPVLGKKLRETIIAKEIKLIWDNGGFYITYYDFRFPVSGETFHELLEENKVLEGSYFVGQSIAYDEFRNDPAFHGFGWSNSRERFQAIYETDSSFELLIDNICEEVNSDSEKMTELLNRQHYTLTHWQSVDQQLNYRRFFTINGLISLSMEKQKVFDDYHSFILENIKNKNFQGLRIDHIDGLQCPGMYFERLRAATGEDTYIVAEKILEKDEQLVHDWPIQGTSGYDFLALVNNLFTNSGSGEQIIHYYNRISGNNKKPEEIIYENKKKVLQQSFQADLENIFRMLEESGLATYNEKVTPENLKDALGEFLVNCPVYKLYSDCLPPSPADRETLETIFRKSATGTPQLQHPLNALKNIFLEDYTHSDDRKTAATRLFLRCMQYTGPLMAKGVEDTTMYSYPAFIVHNEVGDAVDAAGLSAADFHRHMVIRQERFPETINATATHDTKRGEDTRARLNVISDLYGEWQQLTDDWFRNSFELKTTINGNAAPDTSEEYFVYQVLAGVLPMNNQEETDLTQRLAEYLKKSLREAKIHSGWTTPDEQYEKAVTDFALQLLDKNNSIGNSLREFVRKIVPHGITNSLSQMVLKCTCPGIPDFYQGTELWDLSLVDPDNRRPVDYDFRKKLLHDLSARFDADKANFVSHLFKTPENGHIKLWMAHRLMKERQNDPVFFVSASYIPLEVKGRHKDKILAFVRKKESKWFLTIVPLHTALIAHNGKMAWDDTTIELPSNAPVNWELIWDKSRVHTGHEINVASVLPFNSPVVLKAEKHGTGRGSGVLIHMTSLPGKYGTGDLGESAYKFVDLLRTYKQSFWQILPFNPVDISFSPYSSSSAFAGNISLLDPDSLFRQQLLKKLPETFQESDKADFIRAARLREEIIPEAFGCYVKKNSPLLQKRFQDFCNHEKYWLNDFALYCIFKKEWGNKSWNHWPEELKKRDSKVLDSASEKYASELTEIKFGQFLFSEQFKRLKRHANSCGIKIIGDMPIYVSYDSADVWANQHLFRLNNACEMETVAGVPPDYFSKTGQLWNMPVYRWDRMKADKYLWWKKRIRKNLEYSDMLRFDHFRGFSAYWEVPAGEKTAVNGRWIKGPGHDFFWELKGEFPHMPFIAEDLGDIDHEVYKLRDDFELPGMKVLQFAFGSDMPRSVHIPHMHTVNSIVYTGTHDNNTIRGWYRKEATKAGKRQIKAYMNRKPEKDNISAEFIRMASASVARTVILPMQDILDLDETARFNSPSQPEGNWTWKLKSWENTREYFEKLGYITSLFGRDN